ncbi:MAG: prepilin-type N-terminal cleavage/methylation domain-containing protein [Chthoniobacterales bacterium]|nr:prepilin-type N-terminal cleavage/methylation domain-containing protein [Chthoniobacterales bacterium]
MKVSQNKRAFSLLEVLVSISLLLLLLLLLVVASNTALNFWHRSQDQVKSSLEARAALQIITSDLRSAVLSASDTLSKNYFFVSSDPQSENSCLFFLATLPPEKRNPSDLGDLCAVGYFVSSEKTTRDQLVHHLYRFSLPSNTTAQALRERNLLELCMLTASATNPLCERIASNITHFQTTAIWYEEKQFSIDRKQTPPSLVEIVLEIVSQPSSRKKGIKNWRTIVALHE